MKDGHIGKELLRDPFAHWTKGRRTKIDDTIIYATVANGIQLQSERARGKELVKQLPYIKDKNPSIHF